MRLSETEWRVMNVLWARSPATVRDALEILEDETGWTYSTVKTILSRLADKGAVVARKRANTMHFEPVLTRDAARRSAVRSLLDRAFEGTFGSLVHHLVDTESLTADERAELRALLQERGTKRRGTRR